MHFRAYPRSGVSSGGHRDGVGQCCDGVIQPRVCRGRVLSERAMASRSRCVHCERSLDLGRYWRSNPLRRHCFWCSPRTFGIAEVECPRRVNRELDGLANVFAGSQVMERRSWA